MHGKLYPLDHVGVSSSAVITKHTNAKNICLWRNPPIIILTGHNKLIPNNASNVGTVPIGIIAFRGTPAVGDITVSLGRGILCTGAITDKVSLTFKLVTDAITHYRGHGAIKGHAGINNGNGDTFAGNGLLGCASNAMKLRRTNFH